MAPCSSADSMIGRPFQLYGRGPHAFDCVGIVLEVERLVFGVELPDPLTRESYDVSGASLFGREFVRLHAVGDAEPGDVLHFPRSSRQHLAVVERDGWVVHASEAGVVRQRFDEVVAPGVVAYRPKALMREASDE